MQFVQRLAQQGLLTEADLARLDEARAAEVRGARYGSPYPCANAIAVGLSRS